MRFPLQKQETRPLEATIHAYSCCCDRLWSSLRDRLWAHYGCNRRLYLSWQSVTISSIAFRVSQRFLAITRHSTGCNASLHLFRGMLAQGIDPYEVPVPFVWKNINGDRYCYCYWMRRGHTSIMRVVEIRWGDYPVLSQ